MKQTKEYGDLTEIREKLVELRNGLNDFTLRYAKTDFRTDTSEEPDPFELTALIRLTEEIIDLHKDINQTDIIRLLVRNIITRSSENEIRYYVRKMRPANYTLTEEEFMMQAMIMSIEQRYMPYLLRCLL